MSKDNKPRTVRFKATYWSFEETEDDELIIHTSGLTEKGESVHIKIQHFTPFVYLELPKYIKWNKTKCKALMEYFKNRMKSSGPIKYQYCHRLNLYGKKKMSCIFVTFPSDKACRSFNITCLRARNLHISRVGTFQAGDLKVHEHFIDPVIKFTAVKGINLAGWLEVKETIPSDEDMLSVEERKYTTADIDMYAHFNHVKPYTQKKEVIVKPKYCSFDIECYSVNPNSKLPDPSIPENAVFQVGMLFGKMGEPAEEGKRYMLTLFDPHDIEGVTMVRCKTEKELLLKFASLFREEDPDAPLGYNIMKFDWDYMIARAERLGIYPKFMEMSRIIGKKAELKTQNWSSSAYGEQAFRYPNCHGRVNVDVLLEVERNFKMPHYNLNYVSEYFLGEKKDDITPRQLFMLYQITYELLHLTEKGVTMKTLIYIKKRSKEIMIKRKCHGEVRTLRDNIQNASRKNIKDILREALTLTAKYCEQDCHLPYRLEDKLKLWTTMEEMSNVMHVPTSYLHTRGQQIKVLAQVYRETLNSGIVIPSRDKSKTIDEKYQGAIVIEANPGDYDNVPVLDFASLYPTTMIAFNICYTTLVEDDEDVPDEECHVLEWEDHVRCIHDPLKRKPDKDKSDVLCGRHRYRFRKVKIIIHEDGTIERKHEGLMPRLERNLLATRSLVKKEMFKAEARLNMHLGDASDKDMGWYKSMGWEIIEKGSLSKQAEEILRVSIGVLNAKQLAIKVSANSQYGGLGARTGFMPLIKGAASVTAMGRKLITMAIDVIKERYSFCKLVYGDTDSCMLHFTGKSLAESFDIAEEAGEMATHYLKSWILGVDEDFKVTTSEGKSYRLNQIKSKDKDFELLSYDDKVKVVEYESIPIDLEFENMYGRFLLLTKKRYVAHIVNKEGKIIGKQKKGVVLTRRDNCAYLRNTYGKMTDIILDRGPKEEIMNILYDRVNMLFTRQIPETELIIYVGISKVVNYAKKKEKKVGNSVQVYFLDENKNAFDDPIGPLDPRLVYPNLPQVLLSLKLLNRGTDVPPNTRLEFLYCHTPDAEHQGEKAEDYTYYMENKVDENFRPDYLHYIEKQLTNPVTELLQVKYPGDLIVYEKLEYKVNRLFNHPQLSPLKRSRLFKIKTYTKEVSDRKYLFRGLEAKCTYVIDSSTKKGPHEFNPSVKLEAKIIDACKSYKARSILNRFYNDYGITKRPERGPTQRGPKLLSSNVDVILLRDTHGYKKGDKGSVIDRHEDKRGGKVTYLFDIVMAEEKVIEKVPRSSISTYYYRDGKVMKDILVARTKYLEVVESLNNLFCPLEFID